MVRKTLTKRQQQALRGPPSSPALSPLLKPRNPLVAAARQRKAGAHKKTASALRQHERRKLLNALFDRPDDR
jgi:hypothetical protein